MQSFRCLHGAVLSALPRRVPGALRAIPRTRRVGTHEARSYGTQDTLQQAHRALSGNDLPKAKSLFEKLAAEPGATVDTLYNLGVVEWLSKDPAAAVRRWQDALKVQSDDKATISDCHTNLANYFLLFSPDLKAALGHLSAASLLSPDDGEIRYNYGLALERDDQVELALENYLMAEELGVGKNVDALIRNAGAKLLKRNSAYPPTEQELDALKEQGDVAEAPMGTQVDYGPSGTGR